ncbi:maltokinase N-terminal cap-like domain-containing protein [Pseudonocardia asaccharolytica]|uniref:Maltokinase n=1 Tax=Pseudonocardia asaccharolytica DSM 44247 = NBRC 16224 TaxID=1123024 RepID=A0A511D5M7_9PSEU|nr:aminoglycoside phosphotransferase [Pseudonocardia asaccharolytica]GEL20096.1 aminoglycoside phosphotransferase [Pseudonocardia asaccharolytica DSM 44247 = NBRC 16224]
MTPVEGLTSRLADWLPRQRWFGAKGRTVRRVTIAASTPLMTAGEPLVDHTLLAVEFDEGGPAQHYQLLIGWRRDLPETLGHVAIGEFGGRIAYDGLWDHDVTAWLLEALRAGRRIGDIRFVPEPDGQLADPMPGRVLGIEQSNTSVAYGEQSILKLFRHILPGVNPDLELHRALRSVSSREVARLQGAVEGVLDDTPTTLAMMQDFAANSAEGWAMALASVRDLFAEGDLRADEVGGDFAAEAHRLGGTVAAVHAELVEALGESERDPAELASAMTARLTATAAEVGELGPHADAVRAVFDELAALGTPLPVQRVHGDLHLGQTLRTPHGWLLIDFEGEPATPLRDRVRPDSALRDVAGMLRSFDYAAYRQLLHADGEADQQLLWRANEWATRNRGAFCDGYAEAAGADPRTQSVALRAFELDKAVYEARYETHNRPAWAPIPLASITRITTQAGSDAGV